MDVILDTPFSKVTQLYKIRIGEKVTVSLFNKAKISVLLIYKINDDTDNVFTDYKELELTNEEYLAWGTDDSYIIDLVKRRINELI
jgi:hypothetical protein